MQTHERMHMGDQPGDRSGFDDPILLTRQQMGAYTRPARRVRPKRGKQLRNQGKERALLMTDKLTARIDRAQTQRDERRAKRGRKEGV